MCAISPIARSSPTSCRPTEILGDAVRDRLVYYPTVTREPFKYRGRISHLIENGALARDVGLPPIAQRDGPLHAVRQRADAGRPAHDPPGARA